VFARIERDVQPEGLTLIRSLIADELQANKNYDSQVLLLRFSDSLVSRDGLDALWDGALAVVHGVTKTADGSVLAGVKVVVRNTGNNHDSAAVSDADGSFEITGLAAGHYTLAATKAGFEAVPETAIELSNGQSATVELPAMKLIAPASAAPQVKPPAGFWRRFAQAYADDWHPALAAQNATAPACRGYPPGARRASSDYKRLSVRMS